MLFLLRVLYTGERPQEEAEEMEMGLVSRKRGGLSEYLQKLETSRTSRNI